MPRWSVRPLPDRTLELATYTRACPACGQALWAANKPRRTVTTLDGLVLLRLQVRSCRNPDCPRYRVCLRPEQEGRFALPQHEFGLDVIALVGGCKPQFVFSGLYAANGQLVTIYDPLTTRPDGRGGFVRDAFPGNIIPAGRLSPVATKAASVNSSKKRWSAVTSEGSRREAQVGALAPRASASASRRTSGADAIQATSPSRSASMASPIATMPAAQTSGPNRSDRASPLTGRRRR